MGMDVNDKCFIPFLLSIYIKNKKNDVNHTNSEIIFVKRDRGKRICEPILEINRWKNKGKMT